MTMISIGLPIVFLFVIFISIIWHINQSRKGNLSFRLSSSWIIFNVTFTIVMSYILIVNIINSTGRQGFNIINIISENVFGFSLNSPAFTWLIWIILWLIFAIGILVIRNAVKISVMNNRLDELNRSVAIIKGKLNKTIQLTSNNIETNYLSLDEFNTLLKNKLEKEEALIKANTKMKKIQINEEKKIVKAIDSLQELKDDFAQKYEETDKK